MPKPTDPVFLMPMINCTTLTASCKTQKPQCNPQAPAACALGHASMRDRGSIFQAIRAPPVTSHAARMSEAPSHAAAPRCTVGQRCLCSGTAAAGCWHGGSNVFTAVGGSQPLEVHSRWRFTAAGGSQPLGGAEKVARSQWRVTHVCVCRWSS